MEPDKFPSLEDVHIVLSDLTGLFEDRNAMLHTMMKEDKYKDFLLAENLQSMVEADNRDDSRSGGIRTDLANGYEILRAQTTMRKFANFINPASLPIMDLDAPIEFYDDYDVEDEEEEKVADDIKDGQDGSDGKPGSDSENVNADLNITPGNQTNKNLTNSGSDVKLAKGGYVNPASGGSPLKKSLQPHKPATEHSDVKSLEELGLDGDANVASEFAEDLGLDKYKSALAAAMGLPLKAVAAGLGGLLAALSMPNSPEFVAAKEQISSISEAFDLPKPDMSSEGDTNINNQNNEEQLIAGGGLFSTLTNMFGLANNKDHEVSPETPMGAAVTGLQNRRRQNESLIQMMEGTGGPSLDGSAPDKIYASANTHYDQTQTAITNVAESAKSIFKSSTSSSTTNSTSSILNQILGGVYKADIGAQTNNQDINSLTNQIVELNEISMSENNTLMINGSEEQNYESQLSAKIREIQGSMNVGNGITMDMKNSVAPTELEVSRFLLANINTVHGGETSHDIV